MKTVLRPVPHTCNPNETVVELWYDGRFIGTVCGGDGPGVRVITKHDIEDKMLVLDTIGDFVLRTLECKIMER